MCCTFYSFFVKFFLFFTYNFLNIESFEKVGFKMHQLGLRGNGSTCKDWGNILGVTHDGKKKQHIFVK